MRTAVDPTGDYRFLSAPDFLNADIGDLRKTPRWRPGMPNSVSPGWRSSLATVMRTWVDEAPDDVLVAGDTVNGHWGRDDSKTGLFGPVNNDAQRRDAIRRAARPYYRQWVERFSSRGLPVHVAVGDHELGDNPWNGKPTADFKRRSLDLFKREFARYALRPNRYTMRPPGPAHNTAYAKYLHDNLLLVTVDVFKRTGTNVIPELDSQQLAWLNRLLGRAKSKVDWIVVQGHTPVAQPVRKDSTSGLTYRGGTSSAFWQTMARHGVDVYLNGEVHDITVLRRNGITQISHGGRLADQSGRGVGNQSFLVADLEGDQMTMRMRRFRPRTTSGARKLWQTIVPQRPVYSTTIAPDPACVGTLALSDDNRLLQSSGLLRPR
ncbi:metallophosphoesterase [uncultured Nocardioides sp.]|uniref:metallophosphoesterase family protein n=1 Tax=uncultured Nocardioides sp. TaxID=198441 RepID=UPI002613F0D7|nr:metallophosphoesterase [uncultured Nocardioides sp.]